MIRILSILTLGVLLINFNADLIQQGYQEFFCRDQVTLIAGIEITVCGETCTFLAAEKPVESQDLKPVTSNTSIFYLPLIRLTGWDDQFESIPRTQIRYQNNYSFLATIELLRPPRLS